jgi:CMP-N,N'-diacetyllegionaminic acid synthase
MTWADHRVFALVPARGGSRGVPRKNLAPLDGRSLIAHVADVLAELDWLDAAILSTDDEEIAAEGRRLALDVPFLRPAELATDEARAADVWAHAWRWIEERDGVRYDASVLLEPSCPLRIAEDVTRTIAALFDGGHAAAATTSRTPSRWNAYKAVRSGPDGVLTPVLGEEGLEPIRQRTPEHHHRNGACYAVRRDTLLVHGHVFEQDCVGVPVERDIVNIDEPADLAYARWLVEQRGEQHPS